MKPERLSQHFNIVSPPLSMLCSYFYKVDFGDLGICVYILVGSLFQKRLKASYRNASMLNHVSVVSLPPLIPPKKKKKKKNTLNFI